MLGETEGLTLGDSDGEVEPVATLIANDKAILVANSVFE